MFNLTPVLIVIAMSRFIIRILLSFTVTVFQCTCYPRKWCKSDTSSSQPLNRIGTTNRLAALRNLMNSETIDALYVTLDDGHQSEMTSEEDRRLTYISGFSGSFGEALITANKAILLTDSRYLIQADEELDCNWLMLQSESNDVSIKEKWLVQEFSHGAIVGANPKLIAASLWNDLENSLKEVNSNFTLIKLNIDLIDAIWIDKPNYTDTKIGFTLNESYTGRNWESKVNETIEELQKVGADSMIITALDEIAWLLNIRGQDIPYSYLLKAYVILTQYEVILYTDLRKVKGNVTYYFENYSSKNYMIMFKEYEEVWRDLELYSQTVNRMLVPSACTFSKGASKKIHEMISDNKKIFISSPIIYLKAIKNSVEIKQMEDVHVKDGTSMCKLLHQLERTTNAGKVWDEISLAKEVDRYRYEQGAIPSFPTIVAFGVHGSIPHYQPNSHTKSAIFRDNTLVIDSGGQYFGGTTDITRTVHLGNPTNQQKEAYTRVLIGCIQLSSLVFPENLEVSKMDLLARSALWEIGYDYFHGTAHGIGSALNVHEDPINMKYEKKTKQFLKSGYFISNEPGYYKNNEFGIRLENVMEVIEKFNSTNPSNKVFFGFKDVTLVPYDMKLIDFTLLTRKQKIWLNDYNNRLRKLIGSELRRQKALDVLHWLVEHTRHIPV